MTIKCKIPRFQISQRLFCFFAKIFFSLQNWQFCGAKKFEDIYCSKLRRKSVSPKFMYISDGVTNRVYVLLKFVPDYLPNQAFSELYFCIFHTWGFFQNAKIGAIKTREIEVLMRYKSRDPSAKACEYCKKAYGHPCGSLVDLLIK